MALVSDFDVKGTNAARLALSLDTNQEGFRFLESDTGKSYRWDGSAWDLVADAGATAYTDENAQDAVGAMIADTDTLDLTYADATPQLKGDVKKQMSITADSSGLMLDGDEATPGNDMVYGTDGSGTKGWKADPSGGGGGISMDDADPYGIHHRLSGSNADDDEFSSDTSANYTAVTPTGSVNWIFGTNGVLSCLFSGQSANDLCAQLKAMTLADGEWFETLIHTTLKAANYTMIGIVVTDGTSTTSNACAIIAYIDNALNVNLEIWTGTLTNMTSGAASYAATAINYAGGLRLRLKRNSSTSFEWAISTIDGAQWSKFGTSTVNPGFTPTHAGVFVSVWGGAQTAIASFDYLRHMS